MSRKTNQELCNEFRALLTDGAKTACDELAAQSARNAGTPMPADSALHITKPWRGKLWKAFAEIEQRLCPQPGAKFTAQSVAAQETFAAVDWNPPRPQVEPPPRTVAPLDFNVLPRPSKTEYVQGPDSAAPGDFSKPRKCVGCGFVMMIPTGILCASCEMDEDTQSLMDRDRE